MAKDKEFEARMQGMKYAYDIAIKGGMEELEKEIKRRNLTKIPFNISQAQLKKVWDQLCFNMYNSISITFLYALREEFGFGKVRTKRLIDKYMRAIDDVTDMDYMGEHYITLEDYAVEVAQKMGTDFDINVIASCQDTYDERSAYSGYHQVKIERVLEELRENGHTAAADFLEKKLV